MIQLPFALLLSLAQVKADGGLVYANSRTFLAEVARTPQEQMRGLMYRTNLAKDRVMFFQYAEDGNHAIWMKNCLISLDVVWIKEDGTIAEIAENCPPCSPMRGDDCPTYGGKEVSRHFVEFAAGSVKRLGLKKGDRLAWDIEFIDGTHFQGGKIPGVAKGKKKK
jgi:uncharacterized membrane protein (UPF0127 family)